MKAENSLIVLHVLGREGMLVTDSLLPQVARNIRPEIRNIVDNRRVS